MATRLFFFSPNFSFLHLSFSNSYFSIGEHDTSRGEIIPRTATDDLCIPVKDSFFLFYCYPEF